MFPANDSFLLGYIFIFKIWSKITVLKFDAHFPMFPKCELGKALGVLSFSVTGSSVWKQPNPTFSSQPDESQQSYSADIHSFIHSFFLD